MAEVNGGIIVGKRTVMYSFAAGEETITYLHAAAIYTGDLDGPADETFVAVDHVDGTQTHYGWGSFTGLVHGRPAPCCGSSRASRAAATSRFTTDRATPAGFAETLPTG